MRPFVTAILVAADSAEYLRPTMAAVAAQTRPPERLIVVQLGTSPVTSGIIAASEPSDHLRVHARAGFGTALAAGEQSRGRSASGDRTDEWLWLLASDNAPAPDALERLLAAVEVAPSVVIAGPKQMQWDAPAYIHSYGETVTRFGTAVELAEPELDQAQYDRTSDVLAVAAGGMLVRQSIWAQLGGFDPALPAVDDALDFCIRARLAGHRVQLVPNARVRSAGIDAPGTRLLGGSTTRGRRARLQREAQLHRRLVYAPLAVVLLHWLALLPLGIVRAVGQLLRKRPGAAPAELLAAVRVAATSLPAVAHARGRLRRTRTVSWRALRPLRLPWREVRHRRALLRDNGRGPHRRTPLRFVAGGGLATVIAVAAISVVLHSRLIGASALAGGGLLPLGDLHSLGASIGWGWHPLAEGFTGPADPFAYVVALLGVLTFWHPSAALVTLWVAALPIAALGGWLAASRFTQRSSLRVVGALCWAAAPTLLVALDTGRPAAVLVHLAAPFAMVAALRSRRSWTASAVLALLAALMAACSPSLLPLFAVAWVLAVLATIVGRDRRWVTRILPLPLPALALFLPLIAEQVLRGRPIGLLADPGVVVGGAVAPGMLGMPASVAAVLQLLAGWPTWLGSTWDALAAPTGVGDDTAAVIVWSLGIPLVLLAVVGLLWPRRTLPFRAGLVGVGALVLAVAVSRVDVVSAGGAPVAVWPGAALSLAGLGVLESAIGGLDRLAAGARLPVGTPGASAVGSSRRTAAAIVGLLAAAALVLAGSPLLVGALTGDSAVRAGSTATVPALVAAEAARTPSLGLLTLTPQADGGVRQQLTRGSGRTLEQLSTLQTTAGFGEGSAVTRLAAALVQPNGDDLKARLASLQIGYVLVTPGSSAAPARAMAARTAGWLGSNPLFVAVSRSPGGTLYRVADGPTVGAPGVATGPANTATPLGLGVLAVQALILALTLLLALPTRRLAARFRPVAALTAPRADVDATRAARPDRMTPAPWPASPVVRAGTSVITGAQPLVPAAPVAPPSADARSLDAAAPDSSSPESSSYGTDTGAVREQVPSW